MVKQASGRAERQAPPAGGAPSFFANSLSSGLYRRPRNFTESAAFAVQSARGLATCRRDMPLTAGGDFHPALRMFKAYAFSCFLQPLPLSCASPLRRVVFRYAVRFMSVFPYAHPPATCLKKACCRGIFNQLPCGKGFLRYFFSGIVLAVSTAYLKRSSGRAPRTMRLLTTKQGVPSIPSFWASS